MQGFPAQIGLPDGVVRDNLEEAFCLKNYIFAARGTIVACEAGHCFKVDRKGGSQMISCRMILPVALLTICGYAQDVRYNFAAGQDFSRYGTYKWVRISDTGALNQLAEEQLKVAVDSELVKKGLRRIEDDTADLLIAYQAAVGQEKQFTSFSSDWGYGPGWGRGWYGGGMGSGMSTGETSTIYVGQLGLDMYDRAQKKLIWRGTASKTLDTKAKPDKQKKNLEKAIAKLLKNFPPQPKK
jgi:hypothetical protein